MKFLMIVIIIAGGLMLLGKCEQDRVISLSPDQRYEELCKKQSDVSIMASQFIRDRLNLADLPKFETWGFDKYIKNMRNKDNECYFVIDDYVTFTNEFGGKSRRKARLEIAPIRDQPGRWQLLSFNVR